MDIDRGVPGVCLSLTGSTIDADLKIAAEQRGNVDFVEVRADFLAEAELASLARFPALAGMPSLLAFRRRSEGGVRDIAEADRVAALLKALEGKWSYVDLEDNLDSPEIAAAVREAGVTVIRSFHDFSGVPADLDSRLRRLPRSPREIPKAAVMPHGTDDLLRIIETSLHERGPKVVVGMGDWGFPTRVLTRKLGSAWTYCSAGAAKAAPGHIDPATLQSIYRYRRIGSETRLFAVIGNPVLHSRSPWIHNPAYDALGIDAVYVPFQVDSINGFLKIAELLDIRGSSVTVPHKENVMPILGERDRSVETVGSCNTLVREGSSWHGYNTDVEGFLGPLRRALDPPLAGRSVLVVGAGGASRAVISGLVDEGCRVTITNRTESRARELAERFGCELVSSQSAARAPGAPFDIVVQTTSAGMTPHADADPLPGYEFSGREVVYDLIYAPPMTRFLTRAAGAGCRTIGGQAMLLEQAYAQFRLFTGHEYPRELTIPAF